jgi:hypothetical protein
MQQRLRAAYSMHPVSSRYDGASLPVIQSLISLSGKDKTGNWPKRRSFDKKNGFAALAENFKSDGSTFDAKGEGKSSTQKRGP